MQGRIPANVFVRHYWTPSFHELGDRTLQAMKPLEEELLTIVA